MKCIVCKKEIKGEPIISEHLGDKPACSWECVDKFCGVEKRTKLTGKQREVLFAAGIDKAFVAEYVEEVFPRGAVMRGMMGEMALRRG